MVPEMPVIFLQHIFKAKKTELVFFIVQKKLGFLKKGLFVGLEMMEMHWKKEQWATFEMTEKKYRCPNHEYCAWRKILHLKTWKNFIHSKMTCLKFDLESR